MAWLQEAPSQQAPPIISLKSLTGLRFYARQLNIGQRHKLRHVTAGIHQSVVCGRGVEFSEVRAYQPGDEVKQIDWRITARTGKPYTKLYHEERSRQIYLVIDLRRSMFWGTRRTFKSVVAAEMAALIGWSALEQKDQVGALILTGDGLIEVCPKSTQGNFLYILSQLERVKPKENSKMSLGDCVNRLRHLTKTGSQIFLLSDFYDVDDTFGQIAQQWTSAREWLMLWITDPLERIVPADGSYTITDGASYTVMHCDSKSFKRFYEEQFKMRRSRLLNQSRKAGISLLECTTEISSFHQLKDSFGKRNLGNAYYG